MQRVLFWLLPALALSVSGAEMTFNLGEFATNGPPPGFTSYLYGHGRPGDWQVVMDAVPPLIEPATDKAPMVTKRPVLTQAAKDVTDERFPLLIYDAETFGDFTITTRLKISEGQREQAGGIIFRAQNAANFYVVYADAMDKSLRFYKVIDGGRTPVHGASVPVTLGKWHQLKIICRGNAIDASLDGTEAIKLISTTFSTGKIGYWTKSDSMCSFTDIRVVYDPRESPAQVAVREVLAKYSRLRDLKIYLPDDKNELRVVAAKNPSDVGAVADKPQREALSRNTAFVAKTKVDINVVLPLHDRNGDTLGALMVGLESFAGQTEDNALARARLIMQAVQERANFSSGFKE